MIIIHEALLQPIEQLRLEELDATLQQRLRCCVEIKGGEHAFFILT